MSNWLLKTQSATYAQIHIDRRNKGSITRNDDGTFDAILRDDDVGHVKVTGFATMQSAFYAVTMRVKCVALNLKSGTNVVAITEGLGSANAEEASRNDSLYDYVAAWNKIHPTRPLRIATRRR